MKQEDNCGIIQLPSNFVNSDPIQFNKVDTPTDNSLFLKHIERSDQNIVALAREWRLLQQKHKQQLNEVQQLTEQSTVFITNQQQQYEQQFEKRVEQSVKQCLQIELQTVGRKHQHELELLNGRIKELEQHNNELHVQNAELNTKINSLIEQGKSVQENTEMVKQNQILLQNNRNLRHQDNELKAQLIQMKQIVAKCERYSEVQQLQEQNTELLVQNKNMKSSLMVDILKYQSRINELENTIMNYQQLNQLDILIKGVLEAQKPANLQFWNTIFQKAKVQFQDYKVALSFQFNLL